MRLIALASMFVGLTSACFASEAGGEHRSLEDVLEKEKLAAIAVATVNGFEKQDVTKVTMSKDGQNQEAFGDETVYHSESFKRVTLDANVVELIMGRLDQKRLTSIAYKEPFFSHSFRLLPGGKEKDVMHSLGYSYTGSGKEFTDAVCKVGRKIILILGHEGEGKLSLLRAEPFSEGMLEHIRELLPDSANKPDAGGGR